MRLVANLALALFCFYWLLCLPVLVYRCGTEHLLLAVLLCLTIAGMALVFADAVRGMDAWLKDRSGR